MPLTYIDALTSSFGDRRFTTAELASRLGATRPSKLLSELKRRGLVERVGRGTYRCLSPKERPDLRSAEWRRVRDVVLAGPDPKAWTGASALELWTGGGYRVSPSAYSRIYELAVPRARMVEWAHYLRSNRVATDARKRIGARVSLVPLEGMKVALLGGEPVISREAVARMIHNHPGLYGNALELLDDRR